MNHFNLLKINIEYFTNTVHFVSDRFSYKIGVTNKYCSNFQSHR